MEISKNDLEALSETRLKEAELLLNGKKFSGAYYIAGYAVELALKACVAKNFRSSVLPDKKFVNSIYSHNLGELIGLAGLKDKLDNEIKTNSFLAENWGRVKDWNEEARYSVWDAVSATKLFNAISDPANGVLQWLKRHY